MARRTHISILVLALLALAGAALAAQTPVAVSPGNASKVALIDGRCPTFSWAGGEGAKSYELVVYRLGEEGEEAQPVLGRPPGLGLLVDAVSRPLPGAGRSVRLVRAGGGTGRRRSGRRRACSRWHRGRVRRSSRRRWKWCASILLRRKPEA